MFEQQRSFTPIGNTEDDNNYPILMQTGLIREDGLVVAIPVDDYNKITEHFDSIDDSLTDLEEKIGIINEGEFLPSLLEWLWDNKEVNKESLQQEILSMKGQHNEQQAYGNMFGGILSSVGNIFIPEIKLPDYVDIKAVIVEPYITLKTCIHTIVDGVHKKQEFIIQRHIGYPPATYNQPVLNNVWGVATLEDVKEYCDQIIEWKQREIADDDYWIVRNKTIQQAYTEMVGTIEQWLVILKTCLHYDINPYAYWISPEGVVPEEYQSILNKEGR